MIKQKLILKSLTLNNFATFKNQEVVFNDTFNVIVGETGSGKSLILEALQLIFGSRADKKIIRKGATFSTVEAVFQSTCHEINNYFEELGHPFPDNEIIVKRVINSDTPSKSFLNFQQCSLQTLGRISKRYIDLVGQFDNQKLLSDNYQLSLLDEYGKYQKKLIAYRSEYQKLRSIKNEISNLIEKNKTRSQRKDYLEFQINEMEKLNPSQNDELELITKKESLISFQKKTESYIEVNHLISDSQNSLISQINQLISKNNSHDLLELDDNDKLIETQEFFEELSYKISKKLTSSTEDNGLQEIIELLDSYQKLKRKFSCNSEELEKLFLSFKKEYSEIENTGSLLETLTDNLAVIKENCWSKAHDLHTLRVKHSKTLSKNLSLKVNQLMMTGATLKIIVNEADNLNEDGCSQINFKAETNSGEGFYNVKDIASGGELSRILLSFRQILSQGDSVSVFLFDEIDTGIGGETAVSIGKALTEVAKSSQVIAITHLPQIAKFSDHIIDVSKQTQKSRTFSQTSLVKKSEKSSYIRNMAQL